MLNFLTFVRSSRYKKGVHWSSACAAIPAQLRPAFGGAFNIIRSLGTRDRAVALRRYDAAKAEVDRLLKEASGRQTATPAVQAYRAVQEWRTERAQSPAKKYRRDEDGEGHASGSVRRSYGRGVPLKVLAEGMARIRLPLAGTVDPQRKQSQRLQ